MTKAYSLYTSITRRHGMVTHIAVTTPALGSPWFHQRMLCTGGKRARVVASAPVLTLSPSGLPPVSCRRCTERRAGK